MILHYIESIAIVDLIQTALSVPSVFPFGSNYKMWMAKIERLLELVAAASLLNAVDCLVGGF